MYFDINSAVDGLILDTSYEYAYRSLQTPDGVKLNCTPPDVLEFPNVFRKKAIHNAVVCGVLSLYLFIMLAVICDDYLVPAMERLCYHLRLSYDVAGATFLAVATSAPELFVAVIGTFVTKGDIGVGTILGSSVFNVLGIAAVCGIFCMATKLDWYPITRDSLWYLYAVLLLFGILFDSKVKIYEGAVLLVSYVLYLMWLICDRRVQRIFRDIDEERDMITENPLDREEEPLKSFRQTICETPERDDNIFLKIWWVIKYPAVFLFAITTPSARSIFFLSMLLAVLWICIISYFLSWFLTVIGYNIGIPDSIMGLTVLAVGTSIPEIVSSYVVTKKGYGSMAMCNAIGSNTFDIFVCLGLPWTLWIVSYKRDVITHSDSLHITCGLLIFSVVVLFATFLCTRFTLGKFVGWLSLLVYIVFLVVACTLEMLSDAKQCDIESKEYAFLNK